MKTYYTLLITIFVFFNGYCQTPDDFILTYEVDNTTGLHVQYPFFGSNFTIDLGDGNTLTDDDVNVTGIHHTYDAPGVYTIIVNGDITSVNYDGGFGYSMNEKVKSIEQWGTAQWTTMENAFQGLYDLVVNATDVPDLSLVTNMSNMFNGAQSFNSPVNNWDVSNVTNMNGLFYEAFAFNQPLNNWDVSNVTDMGGMFSRALQFNQNINNWNVSNVTNMVGMFGCFPEDNSSFNQPLNDWDVSSVTDMYWMFRNAIAFNQPLNNWETTNVAEMGFMFINASSFNQNINDWDVSNTISLRGMFNNATSFDQPLNDWDISNTEDIRNMFNGASSFNQPLDNWDTTNVIFMKGLFHDATAFNQDISSWDFSSVIDFNNGSTAESFVGYTAMDTTNYDALLLALAQSGLQNKVLQAYDIAYCDTAVRSYLENEANWWIIGDQLGSDCIDYSISGSVRFDQDNNGCDMNDLPVNGLIISAINNNFEYGTIALGDTYTLEATEGIFDVSGTLSSNYFDITPVNTSITLDNTNPAAVVDFCLTANQSVNDLVTTIIPLSQARPGFESEYQLAVQNTGTETINNASATFNFDDLKLSFISSIPVENSSTGNSLSYDLGTIQPFETITVDITMQVFTPPTVNSDDILNFTAIANPEINDETPDNNAYSLSQIVVNSYDPNDKQVMQGDAIYEEEISQYLDYIVRFQNTGTASAINVRILDVLDDKLNTATLLPVSSSHPYSVQISNNNEVEFIFNNINLPDQTTNEEDSNGYIAFKIKPNNNVQIGDIITGSANIYFDYNAPIITNTVQTEILETLSISEISNPSNLVKIHPNPSNGILNISVNEGAEIENLSIYNLQGMQVLNFNYSQNVLDMSSLMAGIYFIEISTSKGLLIQKWIKK
ncbi:BspA family leucine-rich repeat surface protein [Psychroserpens algicola]|uniref:BspA family leucine-rich repeat surface protein n=1 Tax=Psychroserpens algicola TaxID=1719034 RepID=UPI001952C88D|nr:BspA family leucine-rich repeat surface protein [Psychroserpens algicola]